MRSNITTFRRTILAVISIAWVSACGSSTELEWNPLPPDNSGEHTTDNDPATATHIDTGLGPKETLKLAPVFQVIVNEISLPSMDAETISSTTRIEGTIETTKRSAFGTLLAMLRAFLPELDLQARIDSRLTKRMPILLLEALTLPTPTNEGMNTIVRGFRGIHVQDAYDIYTRKELFGINPETGLSSASFYAYAMDHRLATLHGPLPVPLMIGPANGTPISLDQGQLGVEITSKGDVVGTMKGVLSASMIKETVLPLLWEEIETIYADLPTSSASKKAIAFVLDLNKDGVLEYSQFKNVVDTMTQATFDVDLDGNGTLDGISVTVAFRGSACRIVR